MNAEEVFGAPFNKCTSIYGMNFMITMDCDSGVIAYASFADDECLVAVSTSLSANTFANDQCVNGTTYSFNYCNLNQQSTSGNGTTYDSTSSNSNDYRSLLNSAPEVTTTVVVIFSLVAAVLAN